MGLTKLMHSHIRGYHSNNIMFIVYYYFTTYDYSDYNNVL